MRARRVGRRAVRRAVRRVGRRLDPATWPAAAPAARPGSTRRRVDRWRGAAALVLASVVGAGLARPPVSLAVLGDVATNAATFTAGSWTSYLHDRPSPPIAASTAQADLPLDATAPSAPALVNYDTDCDALVGRVLRVGTGLPTEATACRFANWRSAAYPAAGTYAGSATLEVWARKSANGGASPTLVVYLRAFDPAGGTYVELASASAVVTTNASSPFARYTLAPVVASTIAAGQQLELKLVATGTNRNVVVAYDTIGQPSSLRLP